MNIAPPSLAPRALADPIPRDYNFAADILHRNLKAGRAAKVAYIDHRGRYTYAELAERVERFGHVLRSLGMRREERILMCLADSIDWPTAFLGAIKAGVVAVPVNTLLTEDDYRFMLEDSRARLLVVSEELLPKFAKAVETTYTDSVLMAIPIRSVHPGRQGILIDLADIFMTDFAQLNLGSLDRSRSTWDKIKAFPKNVEIRVAATFSGGRWGFSDSSVIDSRGNTLVIHYGLVELPEHGYQPRLADDRVGYFLSAVKDFSNDSKDTSFLRYVNRWRLERADTDPKNKNKLSVPKKKIVFWIENSVPFEYRPYVREGILEWNKAFEKVGFRDAIEVRQQ